MRKHILLFATLLLIAATSVLGQVTLILNGQSVSKAAITINTDSAAPPVLVCTGGQIPVNNVCVCPAGMVFSGGQCTAPPVPVIPPSGCAVKDAPMQLGGNPPIPPTAVGATQVVAFKIAADLLDNKSVGAYQPSAGVSVAISAKPCDMGTGAQTTSGCYFTMPGNNPTQVLIRVGSSDGYMACKKPASLDGYLYVNVAFTGYSNFGQPLTNFCVAAGLTQCHFQFRRDS